MRLKSLMIAALAGLCLVTGCKTGKQANLLPNVSGKAGEVLVVIEREDWEGDLGSAIREVLAADTPYLAQREPLFALSNVPPGSFNNMFKLHRNLLLINISANLEKEGIVYTNDRWARPQYLVQINAFSSESALALFDRNMVLVSEFFEQGERERIIRNSVRYEELKLQAPMQQMCGGVIHFPSGYKLRKSTDTFVWIADEKQYTMQTVMAYRFPASKDPFTLENLVAKRDSVMKENVPGMFEGSYMITSPAVLPQVKSLSYKGRAFMEMRGFWEVHGDYMGGPFVSHAFYSPDGSEIIVTEAFVYCPRYDKRQYLRQVESLLYSFEWKNDK